MNLLKKFVREEKGLETVEYAIIAALITIGAIAFISSIGTKVADKFSQLDAKLTNPE